MSDVQCPYKTFNKGFKGFLKDLKRTFPNMTELKLMYGGYKIVKTLNKKMVVDLWREVAENPYGDHIKKHDDTFFISPDFKASEVLSPAYAAIVPTLIETWKHLDDDNKKKVWAHLDVLVVLSSKCPP